MTDDCHWLRRVVRELTGLACSTERSTVLMGVYLRESSGHDCFVADQAIVSRDVARVRQHLRNAGWPLLEQEVGAKETDEAWIARTVRELTGLSAQYTRDSWGLRRLNAPGVPHCWLDSELTVKPRSVDRLRRVLRNAGWPLLEDQTLGDGAVGSTREDEQSRSGGSLTYTPAESPANAAPSRPVCSCGQEVSCNSGFGSDVCVDCSAMRYKNIEADDRPLDDRIADVQPKRGDKQGGAWMTASAEGES